MNKKPLQPRYPFTLDGLKQKYGKDLPTEMYHQLMPNLSFINTIGAMAGIKDIVKMVSPLTSPFKFKIELNPGALCTGITIIAERVGWFNNQYTFSVGEMSYNTYSGIDRGGLMKFLEANYVTTFNECKYRLSCYDVNYEFADDHRSWASGNANRKRIIELYALCTPQEQKALKACKNAEHFKF